MNLVRIVILTLSIVSLPVSATDSPPTTGQEFDSSPGKFTFAVFSDLTGGEREGIFEIGVEQLNLLRPELIVNVGDLIEGSTDRAEIDAQWDSFDERAIKARAPIYYVGGNHDLLGMELRQAWEERIGPRYYHFVYKNTLFLVLDTDDHSDERTKEIAQLRLQALEVAKNQGWDEFYKTEYANLPEDELGGISAEQTAYLQNAIAENPEVHWTFLFVHKAPWKGTGTRAWTDIELALGERKYTVFHGHRHVYEYEERNGRDYIQLATTGGVQLPQDGHSMDQLLLITVDEEGIEIANLHMAGIRDKRGNIPLHGNSVCFEKSACGDKD